MQARARLHVRKHSHAATRAGTQAGIRPQCRYARSSGSISFMRSSRLAVVVMRVS